MSIEKTEKKTEAVKEAQPDGNHRRCGVLWPTVKGIAPVHRIRGRPAPKS